MLFVARKVGVFSGKVAKERPPFTGRRQMRLLLDATLHAAIRQN